MRTLALHNTSEAYDFSMFEPKRRETPAQAPEQAAQKINNVIALPEKELEKNRRPKLHPVRLFSTFLVAAVIAGALATMVYGQVRLTELTDNINSATKQLSESQSVYTQLQMKSDSQLSAGAVELYAQEQLGMKKAESGQVEYITLSEGDKAQVLQESGSSGWLASLWDTICQWLS